MNKCEKCGKIFYKEGPFAIHSKHCKGYIKEPFLKEDWKVEENLYRCPYCQKLLSKFKMIGHIRVTHLGINNLGEFGKAGHLAWNKGLTAESDDRVRRARNTLKRRIRNGEVVIKPYHPTEEEKERISKSRINYLKKNPDKVPYLVNHHYKKVSYAERYFYYILKKSGVEFIREYRIYLYSLDFASIKNKIDLEIDGEQHYLDKRIVESDKRRNKYLTDRGWKIIRIRWSEYQKMSFEQRKMKVEEILNLFQ